MNREPPAGCGDPGTGKGDTGVDGCACVWGCCPKVNPGAVDGVVVMGDGLWKVKGFEVEVGVADPNPNDNG